MFWNGAYLILGVVDQYVGNCQKNTTRISSVEMNFGMEHMHTLFPWACKIMCDKYEDHASLQSFLNMSQIGDYPFQDNFCLVNFGFDLLVSSDNNHAIIITMNE